MKKLLKFKRVDIDFSSHQRYWENIEQEGNSIAINILFVSYDSEEMKLACKSSYNYYYFAIKKLLELNSFGWLQGKKDAINIK